MVRDVALQPRIDRAPAGVGIGLGEDDRSIGIAIERHQQFFERGHRVKRAQRRRMIGDQEHRTIEMEPDAFAHRLAVGKRFALEMVEPGRTNDEHPLGRFAHLDDAVAEGSRGHEMQVRQLGDGVAHGVVDRALRNLPAMDMRDRNPHQCAGGRGGQRLETVAQQHYDVRLEPLESIGEAGDVRVRSNARSRPERHW